MANLRAAGYTPEQVDDVFITHDHPDHLGGLAHDGKDGIWIATAHLPFAGIGHVSANGRGYRYVPVNYLHDRY